MLFVSERHSVVPIAATDKKGNKSEPTSTHSALELTNLASCKLQVFERCRQGGSAVLEMVINELLEKVTCNWEVSLPKVFSRAVTTSLSLTDHRWCALPWDPTFNHASCRLTAQASDTEVCRCTCESGSHLLGYALGNRV